MNHALSRPPRLDDPPLSSSSSSSSSSEPSASRRNSEHRPSGLEAYPSPDAADHSSSHALASAADEPTPDVLHLHRKRSKLLELLNAYDLLVYMNLAALYYLDTSTLLLLLRSLSHLSKAQLYPTNHTLQRLNLTPRNPRPNVFFMLLVNFIALAIHACLTPASASEAARGYLHGHFIIDLIGQKAMVGWIGRLRLCCMDLAVAGLEFVALGVLSETQNIEKELTKSNTQDGAGIAVQIPFGVDPLMPTTTAAAHLSSTIDDAPHAAGPSAGSASVFGTRRSRANSESGGIELQPMSSITARHTLTRSNEHFATIADAEETALSAETETDALITDHEHLLDTQYSRRPEDEHDIATTTSPSLESLASGQAIVMHLRFEDLVRDQFWEWRNRRLAGRV